MQIDLNPTGGGAGNSHLVNHDGRDSVGKPRHLGVEEEFHLVDQTTRRLAPRAPELLEWLGAQGHYVAEMQQCVIEVNSAVVSNLSDLGKELRHHRKVLSRAAREVGADIVAAGTVPLALPSELPITSTARYRRMLADYQLLAREQLICGTQIHVEIPDRDEAAAVAQRIGPELPTLLALSTSSPFWADGVDTGYSSVRTLVWSRWPTTGLTSGTSSAADLDRLTDQLLATGVISDPGMMYFDVRVSRHVPTLELRICDSCPDVDTILLVAGLYRALVERELAAHRAGEPALELPAVLGRAAVWRAARSGLEDDLVDVRADGQARPASEVVRRLVDSLKPWLEANGDWEVIDHLATCALLVGSSAARQRRALRRRGRLTDVVDLLAAETAHGVAEPAPASGDELLTEYPWAGYDEALSQGKPRPPYRDPIAALVALGAKGLRSRDQAVVQLERADGVTFKVTGRDEPQIFPLDLAPRIVTAKDWAHITAGCEQRAKALDLFLRDVYGPRSIVHDGIIPDEVLDRAPGYRSTGRVAPNTVRAHVSGLDLVSSGPGHWQVLEDNLRVPSGVGYAMSNRYLMRKLMPELAPPALLDSREVPGLLLETLAAAAPGGVADLEEIVLLSSGPSDSAWPEHAGLARGMGVQVVTPEQVWLEGGHLVRGVGERTVPIRVAYVRMDEDMLLSSTGRDGTVLRAGLTDAILRNRLRLANALGNGVADDKAIYCFVPQMVRYYLGEEPIMEQVPTWLCAERDQCEEVLSRLGDLVTKPIDGFGGMGVLIGPDASDEQVQQRRHEIMANPERYIAQEVVNLSTHPTFDGAYLRPRHVDLRVFVHLRERGATTEAITMPAALTRVGPPGNKIVNSSAGGGSKDTWILADDEQYPPPAPGGSTREQGAN